MNHARTAAASLGLFLGAVSSLAGAASPQNAQEIGADAYIFGYPLVTMEMTRRVMTNSATAGDKKAPMGQFGRMRAYPTPEDRDVTTANADTLYNFAWLDVSKEPYVLSIPDMKGRFYLQQMLDAWTDVFQDPGSRTTGSGQQTYVITGPGWKGGTLPSGAKEYKSPTNLVWIIGRIYSDGSRADLEQVHALQDRTTLVPLAAFGKPYTPPPGAVDTAVDMKTAVRDQVNALDANAFFGIMAEAMRSNPPAAADAPMVARLAKIGIVPGQAFDPTAVPAGARAALDAAPKAAQERIREYLKNAGTVVNGWKIETQHIGTYGTDYLQRAAITAAGLGANLPADAIYPASMATADGQPYDGANRYVLHFDKGQMPPVKGFWSLTMYDDKGFLVPNRLNRCALSERDKFVANPDGSVDLYLQRESPGLGKEADWLPAPAGRFALVMRLYWPTETPPTILDGSWKPPAVKRVSGE